MRPLPRRVDVPPAPSAAVAALREALGCSELLAQVLVRRDLGDPRAARAFLAADERHPAAAMGGMDEAVALVRRHLEAGSRIVVHGDYDVDGVCSTAIAVRALRSLGAREVDCHLPARGEDGYGLSAASVERFAARGTGLLVTVDCGVTAVDEVAAARAAGMDVLVTDHHRPRADGVLPDAPLLHPALGGGDVCPDLCAAGVALKLAEALGAPSAQEDRDLAALATVADVVALRGENRRIVREGLAAIRAGRTRPGVRALLAVARADPGSIDEQTLSFRLAPRINASGRLGRADAALELVLTEDPARAEVLAAELDRRNAERRHVEQRILFEAEAQVAAAGDRSAYVLAGEGWHPGVVGIVASRIAERHHRPTVVVGLPPDGGPGTGSGRSVPGFDLLAGLQAGAEHLRRFGGHRAAAGLEVDVTSLDAFRAAFEAHAETALTPELRMPVERVDAVVCGGELGLDAAEELERLAPFGCQNPAPTLLLPLARLDDPRPMGEGGSHLRLAVASGGVRSRAVSFGCGGRLPVEAGSPCDATFTLERNEWRGVVEPRLVLRHAAPCAADPASITAVAALIAEGQRRELPPRVEGARGRVEDRRGAGVAGVLRAVIATGEPVLAVCADADARRRGLQGRIGGFSLTDYATLATLPVPPRGFAHTVALDPPPRASFFDATTLSASSTLHLAWGPAEVEFAIQAGGGEPRAACVEAFRAARDDRVEPPHARALAILTELGLVLLDDRGRHSVPDLGRRELTDSADYRAWVAEHAHLTAELDHLTAPAVARRAA